MRLTRIQIHNFRGIVDQHITIENYTLLVGPNNSGKSTVIDAIRAFYEKDGFKFRQESDFPKFTTEDAESWVELTFKLNDSELSSLKEEYRLADNLLRLRKYFNTLSSGKQKSGFIYAYTNAGSLSESSFYGAKNVQSGKIGELIYIPALSKADEHTKLTGPSALRDLVVDIMSEVIEAGEAYAELASSVEDFSEKIRTEKTEDDRSLAGFEAEFNELLAPWEVEFKLSFQAPRNNEIIKSLVTHSLWDNYMGAEQAIDQLGSGFQRHFIYSLIQMRSRYVKQKEPSKTKEFMPSMTMLLFEEPEAFLHPPQQEILARSLMSLAENEDRPVICSTHSSHFVSKNAYNIPSIVRLHRANSGIMAHQITDERWAAIADSNQAINSIRGLEKNVDKDDADVDMEAVKHFLWLNSDRSNLFFAGHVLLVEGPSEVAFFNKLVSEGRIQVDDIGLCLIDCLGKFNIHRFMNLLVGLGIRHSVLYDADNGKEYHKDINRLIGDAKHEELTYAIESFPGDLEKFLGIERVKQSHRKPQHIVYCYEHGRIKDDAVNSFCELISSCIPSRESLGKSLSTP